MYVSATAGIRTNRARWLVVAVQGLKYPKYIVISQCENCPQYDYHKDQPEQLKKGSDMVKEVEVLFESSMR